MRRYLLLFLLLMVLVLGPCVAVYVYNKAHMEPLPAESVWVLGDSEVEHALLSVEGSSPSVLVAGMASQEYSVMYYGLRRQIQLGAVPKEVWVSLGDRALYKKTFLALNWEGARRLVPVTSLPDRLAFGMPLSKAVMGMFPKYATRPGAMSLRQVLGAPKHQAQDTLTAAAKAPAPEWVDRRIEQMFGQPLVFQPREENYLHVLLALADAHGIRVGIVTTPTMPAYAQALPQHVRVQHCLRLDSLRSAGYTVIDGRDLELPPTCFFDPNHLNAHGAARFTHWWLQQRERQFELP